MIQNSKSYIIDRGELLFQVVLHLLVFSFYCFDQRNPSLELHQLAFFTNYALAALVISYVFLPEFYYQKKYSGFILGVIAVVFAVILIEEFFLEQIFFPDTRGARFYGFLKTMIDVLPVTTMLVGCKFAWDALKNQRELESLRSVVRESELQFLKSQINPHFLFNNLNNLYSYALEDSSKTPELILGLSNVLRYMLYDCREDYVPLKRELKHLDNFIRINELQIEERGSVTYSFEESENSYKIAPLILIVFVENAFKHSQGSQSDGILIEVKTQIDEQGVLFFNCINNYGKYTGSNILEGGIGLENVKKRLHLLYPDLHDLRIIQSSDRFEVQLQLKLERKDKL